MQIYINKNGQQIGPFDESKVLEMLRNGQLSANDSAIRQGQSQWQTLGAMFPNKFQPPTPSFLTPPTNKPQMKKRVVGGIYVASVVLMFFALVVATVLAAIASENEKADFWAGSVGLAILGYLQFLIIHVTVMFYILFKMWDSIQDGISTSTGKAIGFLFIPVYSLYWVFVAWGGFPTEYNQFLDRHQLNVPRLNNSVYTMVPLFILLSGFLVFPFIAVPFIFMSLISQTCDAVNWLNKGLVNKQAGNNSMIEPVKETLLSPIMRGAVFGLTGISILSIIGLIGIGWWNLNPKPSADELPNTIGNFSKTQNLMNKGSFWGLRKQLGALYETADKKQAIVYDVRNVTRDYEKNLTSYAHTKKGDVTDLSGNKIGEFAFGEGNLEIYNGSKRILIWDINQATPSYILPYDMKKEGKITSLSDAEMLDFAKALPIHSQLKFSEATPSKTTTMTTTSNNNLKGGREISTTEKADFTMSSEEFLALTKKSDTTQYLGKVFDVSGRVYLLSSPKLKANIYDMLDINFSSSQTIANLKEDERLKLKCVGVSDYLSRLVLGNCLILENKGIISAEGSPDFTLTADEYEKNTQNVVNKYRGKMIDVTGKVKLIGGKGEYLVTAKSWLTCYPLAGKESEFRNLTEGAEVKFRGLGDVSGLKHCVVISR